MNTTQLGWSWAASLRNVHASLANAYRALRAEYLALHVRGSGRGVVGRYADISTTAEFDAEISARVGEHVASWRGTDEFDAMSNGQLFVLTAARLLEEALTTFVHIPASPESIQWDGFATGENLYFTDDATKRVLKIVDRV